MKIALAAVIIVLIFITIKYILYRRQVKSLCRQLAFLQSTTTNNRLRTDLTEHEILELAQRINEIYEEHEKTELELRRKEQNMKEMITSVSHDIRTPLTSLKGYFQLLMQEKGVRDDMGMSAEERREQAHHQAEYEAIMNERMNTLSDLLDELFTYTKLQNEDYTLELTEQDFTRLVLDTLFSFYEMFKEKNIEPEMDICEERIQVICNDVAVKRVLTNIIRNALLHGEGDITLKYGRSEEGETVFFRCENRVSDSAEINIDRLFQRFYKADKARSTSSTGLGLAIAKELVERMNGKIEADIQDNRFIICVWFQTMKNDYINNVKGEIR